MYRPNLSSIVGHAALSIALFGAIYSFKNYYIGERAVLPAVKALAPVEAHVTMRAVVPHLAKGSDTKAIESVLQGALENATFIHRELVQHTVLKQELLRNQLLLWLLATVASLGVVLTARRRENVL